MSVFRGKLREWTRAEQNVEVVETARAEQSGPGKPAPATKLRLRGGVDFTVWSLEGRQTSGEEPGSRESPEGRHGRQGRSFVRL